MRVGGARAQEQTTRKEGVDEIVIDRLLKDIYGHPCFSNLMRHKGFNQMDSTMDRLMADVTENGHLRNPGKWGICDFGDSNQNAEEQGARAPDANSTSAGRNKGTVSEEWKFWEEVRQGGFSVPTDCRKHCIAGRWTRAMAEDPEMAARYNNITGEKVNKKKKAFREQWAKDEWADVKDTGICGNMKGGRRQTVSHE